MVLGFKNNRYFCHQIINLKPTNMKKLKVILMLVAAAGMVQVTAQNTEKTKVNDAALFQSEDKAAEIKFDTTTHDFGDFSEKDPVVKCTFTFTNTGNAPLVIHQAMASCGCTVPSYTKDPIKPGQKGTIEVTYNGKGKFPGYFKKTITIRTNGKTEMTRLYISGEMEEGK